MRQVGEFFLKEIDRTLFHYTGVGSLLGIVKYKTVWASHAYYLNDTQEILHGTKVLQELATARCEQVGEAEATFLGQLVKWLGHFHTTPYYIFIFSLSEKQSLLSQWRSYTPHGKGVSIGFAPSRLRQILQQSGFRIAKCVYEPAAQKEIVDVLIGQILETYRQRKETLAGGREHASNRFFTFLEEFRQEFLQVLAILKHPSFQEEQEWRIISPYFPSYAVPEVKFREGASMLVPYIEMALSSNGDAYPLFDRVLLGPSPHANLSMNALACYLKNSGACNTVVNCAIPYREWGAA